MTVLLWLMSVACGRIGFDPMSLGVESSTEKNGDSGSDLNSETAKDTVTAPETATDTDAPATTTESADTGVDTDPSSDTDTHSGVVSNDSSSADADGTDGDTIDTGIDAIDTTDTGGDIVDTGDTGMDSVDTGTDTADTCPELPAGTQIFEDNNDNISEWAYYGELGVSGVSVNGQSFTGALEGTCYYYTGLPGQAQAYVDFDDDIRSGDHLLFEFWVRCASASSGFCHTGGLVEEADSPYANISAVFVSSAAGGGWEHHEVPVVAARDFLTTNRLTFRLGYSDQVVQIGGIRLTNYGQLASEPHPECLAASTALYGSVNIVSRPRSSAIVDFEYLYAIEVNGVPTADVTVAGAVPAWLKFDADQHILHGVPGNGDVGSSGTITVTASNGVASDVQNFTVAVQTDSALVGHWPLDESTGTMVSDVSGNHNDGTLYGDISWQPSGGRIGGGLTLNSLSGNRDYVELPAVSELNALQNVHSEGCNYAIAVWVKANGTPTDGDGYGIVQKAGFDTGIWFDSNNCFNATHAFESDAVTATSVTCGTGVWTHVTMLFNNDYNIMAIYINGEFETWATPDGSEPDHDFGSTPWRIGLPDPVRSTMLGNVTVDDVRIYNRLLSGTEAKNLAMDFAFVY